jgi:hypothetical protein
MEKNLVIRFKEQNVENNALDMNFSHHDMGCNMALPILINFHIQNNLPSSRTSTNYI